MKARILPLEKKPPTFWPGDDRDNLGGDPGDEHDVATVTGSSRRTWPVEMSVSPSRNS